MKWTLWTRYKVVDSRSDFIAEFRYVKGNGRMDSWEDDFGLIWTYDGAMMMRYDNEPKDWWEYNNIEYILRTEGLPYWEESDPEGCAW